MNKVDELIERGAARLEEIAKEASARGGVGSKFADELAEDAVFLRKLKPSLIAARARGEAPATEQPREPVARPAPKPSKDSKKAGRRGGVNPILVIGAALGAGMLLAKAIDWRSHAHPRD